MVAKGGTEKQLGEGKGEIHPRTGNEGPDGEYTFFNLGARWGGWTTLYLDRFTLSKEIWNPLCRRLVGSQGRSGRQRKTSLPSGFDPQTIHSVACRYPGLRRNNISDEKRDEGRETEKENSIERNLKLKK